MSLFSLFHFCFVLLERVYCSVYLPGTRKWRYIVTVYFHQKTTQTHKTLRVNEQQEATDWEARHIVWTYGNQHNWNQSWLGLARWGTVSAFKMSLGFWECNHIVSRNTHPPCVPCLWIMDLVTLPIFSIASSQYYSNPTEKHRVFNSNYTLSSTWLRS